MEPTRYEALVAGKVAQIAQSQLRNVRIIIMNK